MGKKRHWQLPSIALCSRLFIGGFVLFWGWLYLLWYIPEQAIFWQRLVIAALLLTFAVSFGSYLFLQAYRLMWLTPPATKHHQASPTDATPP